MLELFHPFITLVYRHGAYQHACTVVVHIHVYMYIFGLQSFRYVCGEEILCVPFIM